MITLKDYFECINYRVTEGFEYLWRCYGKDVYQLDSSNDNSDVNVTFDTQTNVVYELQAWDNVNNRVYRWINPDYVHLVKDEYKNRSLDFSIAIDDRKFIDIEVAKDMLEKATAISRSLPYDTRVMIELDIPDQELFSLMRIAHEQDITLNQMIENILKDAVSKALNEN